MTSGGNVGWFGFEDGELMGEVAGEALVSRVGDRTSAIFKAVARRGAEKQSEIRCMRR